MTLSVDPEAATSAALRMLELSRARTAPDGGGSVALADFLAAEPAVVLAADFTTGAALAALAFSVGVAFFFVAGFSAASLVAAAPARAIAVPSLAGNRALLSSAPDFAGEAFALGDFSGLGFSLADVFAARAAFFNSFSGLSSVDSARFDFFAGLAFEDSSAWSDFSLVALAGATGSDLGAAALIFFTGALLTARTVAFPDAVFDGLALGPFFSAEPFFAADLVAFTVDSAGWLVFLEDLAFWGSALVFFAAASALGAGLVASWRTRFGGGVTSASFLVLRRAMPHSMSS